MNFPPLIFVLPLPLPEPSRPATRTRSAMALFPARNGLGRWMRGLAGACLALCWAATALAQGELLTNGDFEAATFASSWTNTGATQVTGLAGAKAARLGFNTSSAIEQPALAPSAFTAACSFQVAGTGEAQSFHLVLKGETAAAPQTLIALRLAVGGVLEVLSQGEWRSVLALTTNAPATFAATSTYRLQIVGRNLGTASASYDLGWSAAGSNTISAGVAGLTLFAAPGVATAGGLRAIRFEHTAVTSANSYTIDSVSVLNSAAAPPPSTHQLNPAGGPVSLPYLETFGNGAGAFSSGTEWTVTSGVYRNTIGSGTSVSSVSILTNDLGGDPQSAHGFFLSGQFRIVSSTNSGNAVGLALLGSNATFSGGIAQPYYFVDFRPSGNVLRFQRVGLNNTSYLPDVALSTLSVNSAQPFSIEVTGSYEFGALQMKVVIRQGALSEAFYVVDTEPLSVGYFGFRNRTSGGALTVECDNFTLRRLSVIRFTQLPAAFARPGVAYQAHVTASSDAGAVVALSATALLGWMTFTPAEDGGGQLSGVPASVGAFPLTLSATDNAGDAELLTASVAVLEPSGVLISEFLAQNESGLRDEDGDQSDWIELFNSDSAPANVGGWGLSDNPALPMKWTIPAGVIIPAQGFLVVFASGKNRLADPAHLHTNFKLSNNAGSYLGLAQPGGSAVFSYANYPAQRADHSYGVFGSYTPRGYLVTPTPGAPNEPIGYGGFVADPQFSVPRGFYSAPQNVVVTCATPGATLVYTTNGSTPSLTNGAQAGAPLNINVSTTLPLRVSAFAPNLIPSGPRTQSYLFLEDIRGQSASGAAPAGWPTGPVNGQVLDYGMDPDVTSAVSASQMKDALSALPTLSLVTDLPNLLDPETGIYVNSYGREDGYECPVSVELLNVDNTPAFQIDAVLRIRGGASRVATNPKHNFHLYFRGQYGASKLKYPLFGTEGAEEFDRVDLRTAQVLSWNQDGSTSATFNRDEWNRATHGAIGDPYTRSRYYHLYINGQYWGIYGTQERADAAYAASYFGGQSGDYDVIKTYVIPHRVEAADGDLAAWSQLFDAASAGFASDAAYFAVQGRDASGQLNGTPPLLDVDNLIDYVVLRFYAGDDDAPVNTGVGAGVPKNFFAIRPRDGRFGFCFFTHDAESTMISRDVTAPITAGNTLSYFNPRWLSQQLAANAKYRLRFADRVQRHFFNGGAVDYPVALARWQSLRTQLSSAILAESARWGDAKNPTSPRTVATWNAANDSVESAFFPSRRATLIAQLRSRSLFPSLDAPSFSQHGGNVPANYPLSITAPAGTTLFYTVDGSDPQLGGAQIYSGPLSLNSAQVTVKARAKLNSTGEWSAIIEALFTVAATPALPGDLAITEIHYHPAGVGEETEFVELFNRSVQRLDLAGVAFSGAMTYTFGNVTLEPGARILVVKNSSAFAAAYGASPRVAGTWSGGLNNSSDTLILTASNGTEIERVTYQHAAPWPVEADGGGYSLVRINPAAPANAASSWRASAMMGGNPGSTDAAPFEGSALADADHDGFSALIEHFLASSDVNPTSGAGLIMAGRTADGRTTLTFPRRLGADNLTYVIEVSSDLVTWSPTSERLAYSNQGNGLVTETWAAPLGVSRQFLRLRVSQP